jgi:hypothetical protein
MPEFYHTKTLADQIELKGFGQIRFQSLGRNRKTFDIEIIYNTIPQQSVPDASANGECASAG